MPNILTLNDLRTRLSYDPSTGNFTWLARFDRSKTWNTRYAGKIAGTIKSDGYLQINIGGVFYHAHRLAWLWLTGAMPGPGMDIDHKNGVRDDNREFNLRVATRSQNVMNVGRKGIWPKGIYYHRGARKFQGRVTVNGARHSAGLHRELNDAIAATSALRDRLHGEFARHD